MVGSSWGGVLLGSLREERTGRWLLLCNAIVTLLVTWSSMEYVLPDAWSYIALANGILHGEYSMWWHLEAAYPDTVRMPGFPLVIAGAMYLFGTWIAMIAVNLILYGLSLYWIRVIILRLNGGVLVWNLFLLILLPMVYVPFYIGQVYTEIPVLATICLALFLTTAPGVMGWKRAMILGLLFGCAFQFKPVLLLLPVGHAAINLWHGPSARVMLVQAVMLSTFALTLVPFAHWNKHNHDVYSITPLEGGAGVMHFGWWAGKLPGYTEKVYWNNFAGDELVRFVKDEDLSGNIRAFEAEWEEVNAQVLPLLTTHDSVLLSDTVRTEYPALLSLNARFTLERERLLKERTFRHAWADPLYTLVYKAYSAGRFWVIGVQRKEFLNSGVGSRFRMLYATGSTFAVFVATVLLLPLAFRRGWLRWADHLHLVYYLVYFGLLHLPFAIQARYTVPVRLVMFALLAFALAGLLERQRSIHSQPK